MATLDKDKLVKSICTATGEVFSTMMGLDVVPETPFEEANSTDTVDGVVAMIGLAGSWVGGGVIHCDARLARKLYAHMLMETEAESDGVNADVLDAVAEIANMIIGNVKNDVEMDVGMIGMGIPSVVFGKNFATRSAGTSWTVVPFACGDAHLWVKFCLTQPAGASGGPEILGREFAHVKRLQPA
jgi:chemotaxis protein CheX